MKLLLTLFVTVIFFFRISKINKIGPMVAGNELGVKVFHTGPTFVFFSSHIWQKM